MDRLLAQRNSNGNNTPTNATKCNGACAQHASARCPRQASGTLTIAEHACVSTQFRYENTSMWIRIDLSGVLWLLVDGILICALSVALSPYAPAASRQPPPLTLYRFRPGHSYNHLRCIRFCAGRRHPDMWFGNVYDAPTTPSTRE